MAEPFPPSTDAAVQALQSAFINLQADFTAYKNWSQVRLNQLQQSYPVGVGRGPRQDQTGDQYSITVTTGG